MLWLYISLILIGIIVLLVVSFIHIHISFSRVEHDERIIVAIKGLYGLFRYRIVVPSVKFQGITEGILVKSKKENETSSNPDKKQIKKVNQETVSNYYHKSKEILKHTFGMLNWLRDTLKQVRCTAFRWDSHVGVGDAPETAITTGVVWALKSSILSLVFTHIQLKSKPYVSVNPLYNQTLFSTELKCILKIRLGYAIKAGWHLLIRIIKVKGGLKTWQNILFKA
jgi:hypothetical protein